MHVRPGRWRRWVIVAAAFPVGLGGCQSLPPPESEPLSRARLITDVIQRDYWDADKGAYLDVIPRRTRGLPYATMWGNGMQFSVLAAAARHDPERYAPAMRRFLDGLEAYWNPKRRLYSAYFGGTEDVYYDDNQWMILALIEAYEVTGDQAYLDKAAAVTEGCLAGIDKVRGGGSYWHIDRKQHPTKNTCSNAPLATALLRLRHHLAEARSKERYLAIAQGLLTWTRDALQDDRGLMLDNLNTSSGKITRWTFTYNTALMIEGWLELYAVTGKPEHLAEAMRVVKASAHWLNPHGKAPADVYYEDPAFFVVHLVEAMRRLEQQGKGHHAEYAERLAACRRTAEAHWHGWRQGGSTQLLEIAAIARLQWLTADLRAAEGAGRAGDNVPCCVRIELPGKNRILQLAEVEALRGGGNIALAGRAWQSTVFEQAFADRATDGNTNGDYQAGSVSHTAEGKNSPWWELALAKPGEIDGIRIWNRTDACSERLGGAVVMLLNNSRRILWTQRIETAPAPNCLLQPRLHAAHDTCPDGVD